jgi:hypothetical protein
MCGIAGFVSFDNAYSSFKSKNSFAIDALFFSCLRGMDGTGIAAVVDVNGEPTVYKKAMPSYDFLQMKKTGLLLSSVDKAKALLMHTRSSTRAAANDQNCHPFTYDHITLIHNGHITNHRQLAADCNHDVDSAYVAYAFSKAPAIEVLPKIHGGYCFVWHDAKEGTVNIARNDQRPMCYVEVPEWNGIAFMSEHLQLMLALHRNGIKIKGDYKYPQVNSILTIDLASKEYKETILPFDVPATREPPPTRPAILGGSTDRTGKTTATGTRRELRGSLGEVIKTFFNNREWFTNQHTHGMDGMPAKQSKSIKAAGRLKAYKLKYMETYEVQPVAFIPYSGKPDYGFIVGKITGGNNQGLPCTVTHGIERDFWNMIRDTGTFFAHPYNEGMFTQGASCIMAMMDKEERELYDEVKKFKHTEELATQSSDDKPPQLVRGPGGAYIPLERWIAMSSVGCGECSGVLNPDYAEYVEWVGSPPNPICHECSGLMKDVQNVH